MLRGQGTRGPNLLPCREARLLVSAITKLATTSDMLWMSTPTLSPIAPRSVAASALQRTGVGDAVDALRWLLEAAAWVDGAGSRE